MLWLTKRTVRPAGGGLPHLSEALLLEREIADREHLVDNEDVGLEVRRDREREPHVHAARVALDRRVDEPLDLGERDDLVELAPDLVSAHPQNSAVEIDVLAAGELGVKAGADLEQRPHAAVDVRVPGRRLGDSGEDLQQRGLARAVAAR